MPSSLSEDPTAVHAAGEVHAAAFRMLPWPGRPKAPIVPPPGLGVLWSDQLVPFQASARVSWSSKGLAENDPTAVHELADAHDTPLSELYMAPGGLPLGCTDQVEPFQLAASVWVL